jgi:flagellar hook-associated protein 1
MNGLSSALSNALSGLLATSGQSALVSRNVTRANDQGYVRRDVELTTNFNGSVQLGQYQRSFDKNLQDRVLKSNSSVGGATVALEALSALSNTIGDPEDNTSIAANLSKLQQTLRDFQNNPANNSFASAVITASRSLTSRLNAAASEVANLRSQVQSGAQASVGRVNALLAQLQPIDQNLRSDVQGTEAYLEKLDQRDAILKSLSEELGLRVVLKSDGGTAVYTDSGLTLFDVVPRPVQLNSDTPLLPGTKGSVLFIDGVQVSGNDATLAIKKGRLVSQLIIRDETALTYEAQLDETARALVTLFAEHDQSAVPVLPPATGLIQYAGSPSVPPPSLLVSGLAADVRLNTAYDERQGGNPMLLRDGGSNGANYVYNSTGAVGFQQRLSDLASAFDAPVGFDAASKLGSPSSIRGFAEASASGIESDRAASHAIADETLASNQHWTEALMGKTGVNLDAEMASLLAFEKSYQASAKVMTTIDQMFGVLVGIVN